MDNYNPQEAHEALIEALKKTTFKDKFKKIRSYKSWYKPEEFSVNDVNSCAALISTVMNTTGGSVGEVDLYKLLQAYILDPDKKKKINEIVGVRG